MQEKSVGFRVSPQQREFYDTNSTFFALFMNRVELSMNAPPAMQPCQHQQKKKKRKKKWNNGPIWARLTCSAYFMLHLNYKSRDL